MESCETDFNGVLAPLTEVNEIQQALKTEIPLIFRIQGIARDECWVDHQEHIINSELLDDESGAEPFQSLVVNTENDIIVEEVESVE